MQAHGYRVGMSTPTVASDVYLSDGNCNEYAYTFFPHTYFTTPEKCHDVEVTTLPGATNPYLADLDSIRHILSDWVLPLSDHLIELLGNRALSYLNSFINCAVPDARIG